MENYEVLPEIVKRLEQQGYEYQENLGVEGREAYEISSVRLSSRWKRYLEHIALRDYLRENEAARNEYQELKMKLAEQHCYDIDTHCESY